MIVQKSGCVLINLNTKKIGLVYRAFKKDYSFPKGHLIKGETYEECAIRKVEEEVRRTAKIVEPLNDVSYTDEDGYSNIIHFYLATDEGESNNTSLNTYKIIWKDIDEVESTLSYQYLKDFFNKNKKHILDLINKNA